MEPTKTALQKNDRSMEFIPFGAQDKIKLTIEIVKNICAVPTKSGKTCSDRDAIKFMMLCQAQRLNPFAGDAYLVGYDGQHGPEFSLITAHQAFLKRAETNPDFDGMTSGIIILVDSESGQLLEREGDFHLQNENVVGGWAKVFHKKRTQPTYRRIRMERFNKGFAQWKADPAGMIVKCAEADALRSTFPTLLGGLYSGEEQASAIDISATAIPELTRKRIEQPPTQTDDGDLGPQNGTKAETKAKDDPRAEVQSLLDANKITFSIFQKWGEESGNIPDALSMASLSEVPEEILRRLLKAKAGLVSQLNVMKSVS